MYGTVVTVTRLLLRSAQVLQGQDPKKGNKKDTQHRRETDELVPTPECPREKKVDNSCCKPELNRDTDDMKEVLLILTFSYFSKGEI